MTDPSDLTDLAARHAGEPPPLTLAHCLAQAAWWIRKAAEIGQAELAEPAEIEISEYWRGRAETAEAEVRAGEIKGMGIDEDKGIV